MYTKIVETINPADRKPNTPFAATLEIGECSMLVSTKNSPLIVRSRITNTKTSILTITTLLDPSETKPIIGLLLRKNRSIILLTPSEVRIATYVEMIILSVWFLPTIKLYAIIMAKNATINKSHVGSTGISVILTETNFVREYFYGLSIPPRFHGLQRNILHIIFGSA